MFLTSITSPMKNLVTLTLTFELWAANRVPFMHLLNDNWRYINVAYVFEAFFVEFLREDRVAASQIQNTDLLFPLIIFSLTREILKYLLKQGLNCIVIFKPKKKLK